ncbi:interferon alpha/beta receptor 2 [Betta splendens]|uniref:Interferon alpha/beta receptor 2 n=1 Tax=Betta splendens TaxID=158456 RepID=A0A6P7LFS1_BETSP|nr:interferon alpha/beta receptor 2 [Betta splendens]
MTSALWLLTCLPLVLPALSKLPPPVNLSLNSKHFRTVLKWEAEAGTPTGASYQVTFTTDSETLWRPVPGCEQVQIQLVCNLTEVFSDPSHTYLAQVETLLGENISQPTSYSDFKLIRDSQLDLPLLDVTLCDMSLCVDLQFPKLYMLNMSQHYRNIYNSSLIYKMKVNGAEIPQEIKYLQKHIVTPSFSAKEYCVSICFWDRLESKESDYSPSVCASTPFIMTTDGWISAVLCVLVTIVLIAVFVRLGPRCILPLKRPLPLALTSVPHIDVPVITGSSISLPSVLTVVMTKLPSSGERGHKLSSSDESDGESETESAGGDDQPREGAKLLSSSLSPPLYHEPDPQCRPSSAQTSNSSETSSSFAVTHRLSMNTASGTDGSAEPDEEEENVVAVADGQDVNLLTLTFGRHHVEEEGDVDVAVVERVTPTASGEASITSVQTSHPGTSCSDAGTQIMTYSADEEEEEEEEEDSGYMGRPCTSVLQGFS